MHDQSNGEHKKVVKQSRDASPISDLANGHVPDHKMFRKAKGKMKAKKARKMHAKKARKMMTKGRMHAKKARKMMTKGRMKRKHLQGLQGLQWHLVKKNNGTCKCTQKVRGRLSIKKFTTLNECENNRNGC